MKILPTAKTFYGRQYQTHARAKDYGNFTTFNSFIVCKSSWL